LIQLRGRGGEERDFNGVEGRGEVAKVLKTFMLV
jgi:hypothetical protein